MNQKGQAFVEVLILSSLILASTLFLVRLGLVLYLNTALDEVIELTHLCELQNRLNCQMQFEQKLTQISLQRLSSTFTKTTTRSRIQVIAESNFGKIFEKESELSLELIVY